MADALSRVPQRVVELGTLLSSNGIDWDLLLEEVGKDATLVHIRDAVLKGEQVPTGFTVDHDRLFFKGRFVLARTSPFIPVLLREYHDFPLGGHAGELKTYLRLAAEWFGRECVDRLPTTSGNVRFANKQKLRIRVRLGYSKICQFRLKFGNTLPWISLRGCLLWKG